MLYYENKTQVVYDMKRLILLLQAQNAANIASPQLSNERLKHLLKMKESPNTEIVINITEV